MLITHDLGVVAETADKVAVMYAGRVIESCDAAAIFATPLHPYTRGLLVSIPQLNQPVPENKLLTAIPGMVPNLTHLPAGCPFIERCSHAFAPCGKKRYPGFMKKSPGHFVRCYLYEQ